MPEKFTLRYQTQDGAPKNVPLQGTEWTLGRSSDNRIPIGDTTISRQHAVLRRQGSSFFLRELQPRNPILDEHLKPLFPQSDPDRPSMLEVELIPQTAILMGSTWIWIEKTGDKVSSETSFTTQNAHLPPAEGIANLDSWVASLSRPSDHETRAMGALQAIGNMTPFRHGIIGLFIAESQLRVLAQVNHQDRKQTTKPGLVVSDTIATQIRLKNAPLLVTDTQKDAGLQDRHSVVALGIGSVLAVPLTWDDQAKGLLYLDRSQKETALTEADLNLARLVARVLSMAIRSYELEQDVSQRAAVPGNLPHQPAPESGEETGDVTVVGTSKVFQEHLVTLRNVASHDVPTLIAGAPGAGRTVAARLLHNQSQRADHPLVSLQCSDTQESLLERELFGYSADADLPGKVPQGKVGRIQRANRGTLLLKEIADLPLSLQDRLLDTLGEHQILPLGATTPVPVDFRLLATTSRDMEELVRDGLFREELYLRLAEFVVQVPTLVQRGDDVLSLARTFLAAKAESLGVTTPRISPAAADLLRGYSWPGNIGELRHFMDQSFILGAKQMVTPEELPQELRSSSPAVPIVRLPLATVERSHIEKVLVYCRGNVRMAARVLGIATSTLYDKIKRYGLEDDVDRSRTVRRATGQPANQKHAPSRRKSKSDDA